MATNAPRPQIGLTPEEIKTLEEADAEIKHLHQELDKAEAANLDVSEYRAMLQEAESMRSGMLRVYGKAPIRRRG